MESRRRTALRFWPSHSLNTDSALNNLLVIRGGAIGDFIVTLPAIKALRDAFPTARLEILGNKKVAALAESRFYAHSVRSIESPELSRFFAKGTALPADLTRHFGSFDLILSYLYDPDLIFESNLRRSGARRIIHGPATIESGLHATRQLAQPIEELGISISDFAPRLYPSREDRHRAREFLTGLTPPIIALHPGSGSERKNWPLQNWIALGNHFLTSSGGSLVIATGEADQEQAAELETIWKNSPVRFATAFRLTDLAALLENTIFVGHDSGISHLAAATGASSILLFGPTDPEIWGPLNPNARVIHAPDSDLQRLDVELVREALDQELMRIGIRT